MVVAGLVAVATACGGGTEVTLVVQPAPVPATPETSDSVQDSTPSSEPTVEAASTGPPSTPVGSDAPADPTAQPPADASPDAVTVDLPENIGDLLAQEFEHLAEVSATWNPDAHVSMAVMLPDGSQYGYRADASMISASAVKPLWVAAALDRAGVGAVTPFARDALVLSDNNAAGRVIDLAGGVDAVNTWTWETAGLSDTRLEAWRFEDPSRVAEDFRPQAPLGNRTTTTDLARFYARLRQGELLATDQAEILEEWLRDTSRALISPLDLDGALLDRLPAAVADSAWHKAGWLQPFCCAQDYRQVIDAGLAALPEGGWMALAVATAHGEHYDLSLRWTALAACRIYARVADDAGLVCERDDDGVHNPDLWAAPPSASPTPDG
ncbi:serine hydrolase [Candidatus Poriferisocius sp.]|uniref:serine hydrolase n=1 Tax=Candidatus Poriferisocius sp. TaxID=3101276 RepID=UPI003B58E3A2